MPEKAAIEHHFGGEGVYGIYPLVFAALFVAALLILLLPRKYVFAPFLAVAFLIPLGQGVYIAGLNFNAARLIIMIGWVRLVFVALSSGRRLRLNAMDRIFLAYGIVSSVAFVLLWGQTGAIINRLGFLFNALGIYFLTRYFVRDFADVDRTIKILAVIACVLAACMSFENITGRNLFSAFGGVPELTRLRNGYVRSQGPFAHALTAGTMSATLLPLMLCLWKRKASFAAALGGLSVVTMAICAASSTPLLTLAAAIGALSFWPARRYLAYVKWGTVAVLLLLHVSMKAPVWALIGRIDLTGASSSYHRYQLVDQFIRRFSEWWLVGTQNTSTWGWDMWDTINSYVSAGTSGGLISLLLFIAVIAVGFRVLGKARRDFQGDRDRQWQLWCMSCTMFAHSVGFFGIWYFDQSVVVWYVFLGLIGSVGTLAAEHRRAKLVSANSSVIDTASDPVLVGTELPV